MLKKIKGTKLCDIRAGSDFLNIAPKAQTTKAEVKSWDCHELKSFFELKDNRAKISLQDDCSKSYYIMRGHATTWMWWNMPITPALEPRQEIGA